MPPWKAEPGFGEFEGARVLEKESLALIEAWVKGGMKEGNPEKSPEIPKYESGWRLGKPDLVVQMKEPYLIPAEGPELYERFVIPLDLEKDQYIKAAEFRPTSPQGVHHVFIMRTNKSRQKGGDGLGFEGELLEGWTPGAITRFLPEGVSKQILKGDYLVLRSHLKPSGKAEYEQSQIGLYFGDAPKRVLTGMRLHNNSMDIPAGDNNYVVSDSLVVPADSDAIGIAAHCHYLGREVRATATFPDGSSKWLLLIKDWDFNWQEHFRYKEPVYLPKGTRIDMTIVFDNSGKNPQNPFNPPRRVRYGGTSTDEMAIMYVEVLLKNESDFPEFKNLLIEGKRKRKEEVRRKREKLKKEMQEKANKKD